MFKNLFGEKMSFREWFAWKLVCIAHRIFNPDFYEVVKFDNHFMLITSSRYGHGIVTTTMPWDENIFDDIDEAFDFIDGEK